MNNRNSFDKTVYEQAGATVQRLNPHLFPPVRVQLKPIGEGTQQKRLRQERPLNQLEQDWGLVLKANPAISHLRAQSLRVRLANGAWYKPDWSGLVDGRVTAWECKGPKQVKGCSKGLLALKVAAAEYPEFRFILVWRESGNWRTQEVLP